MSLKAYFLKWTPWDALKLDKKFHHAALWFSVPRHELFTSGCVVWSKCTRKTCRVELSFLLWTLQTSVWHDSVVILSRTHTRCDSMTKLVIITGGVSITKLWTPIRLKFCLHLVFVVLSNTPERHALGLSLSASTVDPWTPYRCLSGTILLY